MIKMFRGLQANSCGGNKVDKQGKVSWAWI